MSAIPELKTNPPFERKVKLLRRFLKPGTLAFAAFVTAATCGHPSPVLAKAELDIPALTWTPRSDWINVKTDVKPAAVGDGKADDTAALQAALSLASPDKGQRRTVYLPPGHYRITKTLAWDTAPKGCRGVYLLGSGRNTLIEWGGEPQGTMFHCTGATRCRYIGIVWDGQNKAAHAYAHLSLHAFETFVRHENEAFLNFTQAAIYSGRSPSPTAEVFLWNCLFKSCATGVIVGDGEMFNDYTWMFDGCEFESCGTAIDSTNRGKTHVYNTHFSNSRIVDFANGACTRIRRCTSVGSNEFYHGDPGKALSGGLIIEDCKVDSWKSKTGAISWGNQNPLTIFDCVFTNPPDNSPPVAATGTVKQNMIESNNSFPGCAKIIAAKGELSLVSVPAGKFGGAVKSADQHFLKSTWPSDGTAILDAKNQYGAVGDGIADDSNAIQKAINDARTRNNGSLVYLPSGTYKITKTLNLTGGNYTVQSGGYGVSEIIWSGPEDKGTMLAVDNPQNITLDQLKMVSGTKVNGITVTASSACKIKLDGIFHGNPKFYAPISAGIDLERLPKGSEVDIVTLFGKLAVNDSGQANILLTYSQGAPLVVKGGDLPKTGLFGVILMDGGMTITPGGWDVRVEDNQDLVIGDYYSESTFDHLFISGSPEKSGGRVTIQGIKQNTYQESPGHKRDIPNPKEASLISIDNYGGQIMCTDTWMFNLIPISVTQKGTNHCDLALLNNIYSNMIPQIRIGDSCRYLSIHNMFDDYIKNPKTRFKQMPNQIPNGSLDVVAKGFDHLRQLGALDLKMHYER